jgi:hypothetical protein
MEKSYTTLPPSSLEKGILQLLSAALKSLKLALIAVFIKR